MSFGSDCAKEISPAVFARVDHVLDWIYEIIGNYFSGTNGEEIMNSSTLIYETVGNYSSGANEEEITYNSTLIS